MTKTGDNPAVKIFFPNLDGLRTLAFLMVFLHHTFLLTFSQVVASGSFFERALTTFFYGGTGVSVFFVLSGFLITFLLLNEKEKQGKINIPFFYIRRLLRIWPLYFIVIVFSVSIFPILKTHLGSAEDLGTTPIYYYTFLSNFDSIRIMEKFGVVPNIMSGVTWSVSVEEQFYLIWPLLFTLVPSKKYQYIFISVIIFSIIFRIYNSTNDAVLYFHSFSVCGDLAVGGLSAYFSFRSNIFKEFLKDLNKTWILVIYLLGFIWLLYGNNHVTSNTLHAVSRIISTIFFAFIILEQNYCNNSFYKFSKSKLLTFWGKYTYGLYMLHGVALWGTSLVFNKLLSVPNPDAFSPSIIRNIIAFFLSLALAYASYEMFERKFLTFKDKFAFIKKSD